jgi:trk system potassium uptake protein TrkA
VLSYIELSEDHSLIEVEAPAKFHGKTIGEIDLRRKHGVNLVAIKRRVTSKRGKTEEVVNDLPMADDVIEPGDVLVVVGKDDKIEAISSE